MTASRAYTERVIAQRARERSIGVSKKDAAGRWLATHDPERPEPERLFEEPERKETQPACDHPNRKLRPIPPTQFEYAELARGWRCRCGALVVQMLPHPSTRKESR